MTIAKISDTEVQESTPPKAMIILNVVLLVSCVVALLVFRGQAFFEGFDRISNDHIYIEVSNWDIPVFVSIPCFLALIAILILRITGSKTELVIQKLLKIAVVFSVAAILIRIPIGYLNSSFLGSAGYTPCWQLSSPSLMAPTVWVSNSGYCLLDSGSVRDELLEWIDSEINAGKRPTPNELASEVDNLRKLGAE